MKERRLCDRDPGLLMDLWWQAAALRRENEGLPINLNTSGRGAPSAGCCSLLLLTVGILSITSLLSLNALSSRKKDESVSSRFKSLLLPSIVQNITNVQDMNWKTDLFIWDVSSWMLLMFWWNCILSSTDVDGAFSISLMVSIHHLWLLHLILQTVHLWDRALIFYQIYKVENRYWLLLRRCSAGESHRLNNAQTSEDHEVLRSTFFYVRNPFFFFFF